MRTAITASPPLSQPQEIPHDPLPFVYPPSHRNGDRGRRPWEAPLQSILQSIEGPVAKIIAVIIIIVTGLTLAFGDTSGGFRRLIQIVFGLSIAFAASSFFLSFFSFGGGALV
jgi:type IV secretion system protein VirB2